VGVSSGVEVAVALDAAVVLSLGTSRVLGGAGQLTATGMLALAALAEGRADAHAAALAELRLHEEAVRAVLACNDRIAVLTEAADRHRARLSIPVPLDPADLSPRELVAWSDATNGLLEEVDEALTRHIAAQAVGSIFQVPAARLASDPATGPDGNRRNAVTETGRGTSSVHETRREAKEADDELARTLVRVLSRLAADTADADRRHVAEAAERVGSARGAAEAEGLLSEVRLRVQAANARTAERKALAERERATREAARQAEAERAYLLDAVTSAFGELGYEVDEGFETLTARDGEVILSKDAWPDHAIRMRVDDGAHIRAALVRTAEAESEEERRIDVEREEEWCAAFEAARARLSQAGVRSDVRWRLDPGEHRLPVSPEARRTRTRAKRKERTVERQREGGR
jgi:hypothetical protein